VMNSWGPYQQTFDIKQYQLTNLENHTKTLNSNILRCTAVKAVSHTKWETSCRCISKSKGATHNSEFILVCESAGPAEIVA
jgi:hypothetical protein